MTFSFDLSDELRETVRRLVKRDKKRVEILNKKIKEVISCDENTIEHYKNLRHDLSDYKRVHLDKSLVLVFKVLKKQRFVLFERLEHHDKVYG